MNSKTEIYRAIGSEFSEVFTFMRGLWNEYMLELHPDMTRGMIPVLLAVARQPGTTVTEISIQIGADKTIVSKQANQLRAFDLIVGRPSDEDKRVMHLELSDLGRSRIEAVRMKLVDNYRSRFEDWSTSDVQTFLNLLQRFNEA